MTARRRVLAALLAVALAPLTLALLDRALAGIVPGRTVPADADAAVYFAALGRYAPDDPPPISERAAPKPPGVFRIAILGESTVAGTPFGAPLSVGNFLVEGLRAVHPSRAFDRYVCAEPGRSTTGCLRCLDAVFASDPDALVIYVGQNEFMQRLTTFSPFGKARRGLERWFPHLCDAIETLRDANPAPAAAPSNPALALARRVLAFGDRESEPWVWLPITERERALHAERFRDNLGRLLDRVRERRVPLICIRPASRLRCAPLSSGRGFDPRAEEAYERGEFERARDLDPAPVRMTSDFLRIFDEVVASRGAETVDFGAEEFLDFVHPPARGQARLALETARRLGLLSGDEERFTAAGEALVRGQTAAIEAGAVEAAQLWAFMYLTYGNRAAAEAVARAIPRERRDLRTTLALDLALRFGGKLREAEEELAATQALRPEWGAALDEWRRDVGRAF